MSSEGIVTAGCPVDKPSFVAQVAIKSAEKVVSMMQTLLDLELSALDQLLLLRKPFRIAP